MRPGLLFIHIRPFALAMIWSVANKGVPMPRSLKKEFQKMPQYTRLVRHLKSLIFHSTFKKIVNLMLVESEWMLRRQTVWGRPYILIVDPTNVCNLRCPLCPTGTGDIDRGQSMLSYECFTQIIDRFAPYTYEVSLHNWGEPLLNKEIFKMIEYAQSKNIGTNMSTNLNTVRDSDIENTARSSLEYLIVSLDGTTDEVYSHYRRNGNFQMVMNNLQSLIEIKRRLKRRTPFIEWQFILMKHNIHQVEDARRIAKEIGVDLLRFIPIGLPFDAKYKAKLRSEWFPQLCDTSSGVDTFEHQFLQKPRKSACFYLYRSLIVNPDNRVSPCCIVYGKQNDFGDILSQSPERLWNNERYRSARSLFSINGKPVVRTICERCNVFERRTRNHSLVSSREDE